jgi:hypothetical protein
MSTVFRSPRLRLHGRSHGHGERFFHKGEEEKKKTGKMKWRLTESPRIQSLHLTVSFDFDQLYTTVDRKGIHQKFFFFSYEIKQGFFQMKEPI